MQITSWTTRAALVASLLTLAAGGARAEEPANVDAKAVAAELAALRTRVAELERKENEDWLTERRAAEIRSVVEDVLKDSKSREKTAAGPDIGYNNGFFIQTPDKNFK